MVAGDLQTYYPMAFRSAYKIEHWRGSKFHIVDNREKMGPSHGLLVWCKMMSFTIIRVTVYLWISLRTDPCTHYIVHFQRLKIKLSVSSGFFQIAFPWLPGIFVSWHTQIKKSNLIISGCVIKPSLTFNVAPQFNHGITIVVTVIKKKAHKGIIMFLRKWELI